MANSKGENCGSSKAKKIGSYVTISMFLLVVMGLFVVTLIKPDQEFSDSENRVLASRPKFSIDELFNGSFTKDYETYITDQFVERDNFIALKVYTEQLLGKKDINGVYFSPKNYIIEEHKKGDVDESLSTKNIERVKEFIDTNKDAYQVHFMLSPTASNIYADWLPKYNLEYDQSAFIAQAKEAIDPEYMIDTSNELKEHKEEYVFYKTDHHWTSLGAYYGYTAWAKKTGIAPYGLEEFDRKVVSKDFLGTTYSKVNTKKEADSIELFSLKNGPKLTMSTKQGQGAVADSIYDMDRLKEKDQYTMFLGGNHPYVEINSDLHNGKTLLLVKDSYAHCLVPFLANHYEKIILVDYRYFNNSTKKLMKENKVTDVLIFYNVINFVTDKNIIKLNK